MKTLTIKQIIVGILTYLSFAIAQEAKDIHIQSLDDNVDPKSLSKDYTTHSFKELKSSLKAKLPNPKELNSIFEKAGLGSEIKKMDQMDRDLLYLKAKKNNTNELKKSYPMISETKLAQLKKIIENKK